MRLYRSLEDYINDLSYDSEVKFENLRRAFSVFFQVLGWYFTVFVLLQCLPRLKKLLIEIAGSKMRFIKREV